MIKVERTEYSGGHTAGIIFFDREAIGFTIEPPWKDNRRDVSCIPAGAYLIERFDSPSMGKCLVVRDVPNRTGVLIHAGNIAAESKGCILPGLSIGEINGVRAVKNSRAALRRLLHLFDRNSPEKLALVIDGIH